MEIPLHVGTYFSNGRRRGRGLLLLQPQLMRHVRRHLPRAEQSEELLGRLEIHVQVRMIIVGCRGQR